MTTDAAAAQRPARWGLAVKLFAVLALLGASAVLVTGVLGYIAGRDSLQRAIFRQLSAARQTKMRQVESYFRDTRNDLRLLASTKMVVDAMRDFRRTYEELEAKELPADMTKKVDRWYDANYLPDIKRQLGKDVALDAFLPNGPAANYLQYQYIVTNPYPSAQRKLLDDAGDGSAYSTLHAIYHPLLRNAASIEGFADLLLADTKTGRLVYGMAKEEDFATSLRTGPYRDSMLAAAVARCSGTPDISNTCLEDFAPYIPAEGQPAAFMAAPVVYQGEVIGVLVAQLSIGEIDRVVTGDKRWRQEGFGATGESYLVGPDLLIRSGSREFYENRERYYKVQQAAGTPKEELDAIRRYGSPILHQRVDTAAVRAALSGVEGQGEITGVRGMQILASWGPLSISGVNWGLVSKIDASEAFAPIYQLERNLAIVGGLALLAVIAAGAWLSRSLLGPLRELTAGVKRFAAGERSAHVAVRSQDEIGQLCTAFNGMVDDINAQSVIIESKNRENEALLLNVLPAPIANRLRGGEQRIADGFAEVTVAFADIVGFTAFTSDMPPQDVVTLLNGLFTRFDAAANELGIEKIKTVGDAYMAVCGLPEPVANHAERMVRMAIRMVHITREHALEHKVDMKLRVGVNSGPVVAGVIGKSKYIYDLWGDTVNLASRMESGGIPNSVQVTRSVYEQLKNDFKFEARGEIEVKGKGQVEAWLLRL
jgi:class 3 adenylate cyclase